MTQDQIFFKIIGMHNVNRFIMMMNQVPKIIIFVCFLFVEIISQINISFNQC
jgi:hypothetical protein